MVQKKGSHPISTSSKHLFLNVIVVKCAQPELTVGQKKEM